MRLIGITGKAGVGKDTAADILVSDGWCKVRFADPLKYAIKGMFGLSEADVDGERKEDIIPWLGVSPRYLMQTLGTEWGRRLVDDELWIKLADRTYERALAHSPAAGMVVPDVRFQNEAEWIRDRGGQVIEIRRHETSDVNSHVSEAGIGSADYVINNDGAMHELQGKIRQLVGGGR